jgi:hypothetical protein
MAVHLTAADLASVMLLLDASTIAKNVGLHLVFEATRRDVCSHSDLDCDASWVGGVYQVLDLRQHASVWIATSFRPRPRMCKHANPVQLVFCGAMCSRTLCAPHSQPQSSTCLCLTGLSNHKRDVWHQRDALRFAPCPAAAVAAPVRSVTS